MSVCYSVTLVWTLKLSKVWKTRCQTLQHGYGYGDILMLHDIITTYEWLFCYNWHDLYSNNKLLDFSSIYYFLVKYATWISNMNELLPHPLLCWNATRGAGGLRSGNQLILGNAKQYSDMKYLNNSRYGLGRTDLFPNFCGDGLYNVPPTRVDKFLLSNSGYSFLSQPTCQSNIIFFELCWL